MTLFSRSLFNKKIICSTSQKGATAVEFAVVAVLVLLIVLGIIIYGLIFLQEHYVATAAREGARFGVRANNYDCFRSDAPNNPPTCKSYRKEKTEAYVKKFFSDETNGYVFYNADDVTVEVDPDNLGGENGKVLIVSVSAPNFLAPEVYPTRLLKIFKPGSNIRGPELINFTAILAYEDPTEYDIEKAYE